MGDSTGIRWTAATWNTITGCSKVSPGCAHCYAETLALGRLRGKPGYPGLPWLPENAAANVSLRPDRIDQPRRWAEPRRIFVNSMSDQHHELIPDDYNDRVYDLMAEVDRHVYQVLTKRPERMADYVSGWLARRGLDRVPEHIWLGTSIENDRWVTRADAVRRIPVDVRFLSLEPLLAPLPSLNLEGIAWIIVGGESGHGYRPMDHAWARDLRDRALAGGVAFFFKQSAAPRTEMGQLLDGQRWEQMPDDEPFRSRRRRRQDSAQGPLPEAPATQIALPLG